MRVLVCGDRNWQDRQYLYDVLDHFHAFNPITCVIEGEARGADVMAKDWAVLRKIRVEAFPALWSEHGRAAGPIRNTKMLTEGNPDYVVAFHPNLAESKGTKHMVAIARKAGKEVYVHSARIDREG